MPVATLSHEMVRASKNWVGVKLRVYAVGCNLFARNEVRSAKTEVKLRFSAFGCKCELVYVCLIYCLFVCAASARQTMMVEPQKLRLITDFQCSVVWSCFCVSLFMCVWFTVCVCLYSVCVIYCAVRSVRRLQPQSGIDVDIWACKIAWPIDHSLQDSMAWPIDHFWHEKLSVVTFWFETAFVPSPVAVVILLASTRTVWEAQGVATCHASQRWHGKLIECVTAVLF